MKIEYKDIILRDMTEADIEDDIRWYTLETDWSKLLLFFLYTYKIILQLIKKINYFKYKSD